MWGCTVVWWLVLLPHSKGSCFKTFLCQVCMFAMCMCGFPQGVPASSHCLKACMLGFLMTLKLTLGVSMSG